MYDILCKNWDINVVDDEGINGAVVTIQNKYFTADVLLRMATNDDEENNDEGVVWVFEEPTEGDSNSLNCQEQSQELALRIGVCVSPPSGEDDDLRRKRVLWCIDHGYGEYVEIPDSQLYDEAKIHTSGFDEREKEGFACVVEAIEGTLWSSAVRHVFHPQSHGETTANKKEKVGKLDASELKLADTTTKVKEERPPTATTAQSCDSYEPPLPLPPVPCSQEEKDEKPFDDLESLLQSAARIRKDAKEGNVQGRKR